MPDYFAAFLDLRNRRCLVVGGGPVGERKVRGLLECGARVVLVSPTLTAELARLVSAGPVVHHARAFRRTDIRGCAVAVAATGRAAIDRAVALAARRARVLVNAVDRPEVCDFILPSVLKRGQLQIAVSTGGRSPALAREIRRRLEALFGPEYAALVEGAGRARRRGRARAATAATRVAAGERAARRALAAQDARASWQGSRLAR